MSVRRLGQLLASGPSYDRLSNTMHASFLKNVINKTENFSTLAIRSSIALSVGR
jgi:hypothetical protein